MSGAIVGVGAVFERSDMATSPVFTALAEVNSIDGPNLSRDTVDVTSLDSTGGYREFVGGFRDGGSVTLEMNFLNANLDTLKGDFEASTPRDYRITLPDTDSTALTFSALVSEMGMSIPTDDKVTMSVTFKISGEVTVTP